MGILKWICKKFSCSSNCKYNGELEGCPQKLSERIKNIENYDLNIKDLLMISKIVSKKKLKEVKTLNYPENIDKNISCIV